MNDQVIPVPEHADADEHNAQYFRMPNGGGNGVVDVLKGLPLLHRPRVEDYLCFLDGRGRVMHFPTDDIPGGPDGSIICHAILAAFAAGAVSITWADGSVTEFDIRLGEST